MAPTIHREGPYRFFFFSEEGNEPAHVHVQAGGARAKVWLHDNALAQSSGFADHELAEILRITKKRAQEFREGWDDYFASK